MKKPSTFSVILAAAGQSSRFHAGGRKKPFAMLKGKSVWLYSAELFFHHPDVKQIIVVISKDDREEFLSRFGPKIEQMGIEVVLGGNERADSVENALEQVRPEIGWVAIHDAARPCLSAELVENVFVAARAHGAAIPAVPVFATLKQSLDGKRVDQTIDRSQLYLAQTPQVFARETIVRLYANRNGAPVTDESALAEREGVPVALVPGSRLNLKITTMEDMKLASACLDTMAPVHLDGPIPENETRLR